MKYTIASAISTLRNISTLFMTISIDNVKLGQDRIFVEGSYAGPNERGKFQIDLDKQMNIININLTR